MTLIQHGSIGNRIAPAAAKWRIMEATPQPLISMGLFADYRLDEGRISQ
ncbi:MAG: hypothetical protein O3A51_13945 [Verrucomicrobia bacterium]|nr:hypothetical protein [Verrucomicrobiota bacterium]